MPDPGELRQAILERLAKVIDPETGVDVVRMRLIEDLTVSEDGCVTYKFRPSSPLCPIAMPLSLSINMAIDEVEGVTKQDMEIVGYIQADELTALFRQWAEEQEKPDEVHILQPTRPPAETWVQPSDEEGLLRARVILGDIARVIHPASGSFDLSGTKSLVEAVVGIITRHPMREDALIETLKHFSPGEVASTLEALEKSGKAQVVERLGVRFWSAGKSYYGGRSPNKYGICEEIN